MITDVRAAALQLADQIEDDEALLDPHRRQRLVEQDHLGVGEDRPGHGDRLALPAREQAPRRCRPTAGGWPSRRAAPWLRGASAACRAAAASASVDSRFSAMLRYTGRSLIRARSWYTVSMPALAGVVDRTQRDGLAVEVELAGVGLVEPGEDLDQRRLAGTVVADQAEHLAAPRGASRCRGGRRPARSAWRATLGPDDVDRRSRPPHPQAQAVGGDVEDHRGDDGDAEDHVERVGADPLDRQAVAQHAEDEGAEEGADRRCRSRRPGPCRR